MEPYQKTTITERAFRAWVDAALLRESLREALPPWGLEVLRHDVGTLGFNRSNWGTPLQIGDRRYERGLGTHCVSEIVVRLEEPGSRFQAEVGMDNHYTILGPRGSVVFTIEVAGSEVFRSGLLRAGDNPLPVHVNLDGAREFILRVLDAEPGQNQADWADAAVTLQSGTRLQLDEMPLVRRASLATALPFSFRYGGRQSADVLSSWERSAIQQPAEDGKERHLLTYTDPETGLEVGCGITVFDEYPAIDWVLHFRNTGYEDTPVLEGIQPLDLQITAPALGEIVLHHAHGSSCTETDFLPVDLPVEPGADIVLGPTGGRSSSGAASFDQSSSGKMPFFNLEWGGGGLVGSVGWSGQWEMRLVRGAKRRSPLQDKPALNPEELHELSDYMEREFARQRERDLTLTAGQQKTRLKLHPGESIRTPRILLVTWQGDDPLRGNNLHRRLLLDHYVPRRDGQVVVPSVACLAVPSGAELNDTTEQNQLEAIDVMAPMGVEAYWLDAGWFEGGWPNGVGNWVPDKKKFPRGLKVLGDAAHRHGIGFVLWLEPERVNPASRIAKEHPEWVLHADGQHDGLFNLGDPEARVWLTDYLSRCISEWGVTILRQDFNIEPLPFWQAADRPGRQGITEIRYIEGLYALWDELRQRHPNLAIDNCASGGRRIDLETMSRSFPLWRSDTQCAGKPFPVWDQVQTAGLSLYVPLHTAGVMGFDPYTYRSVATMGVVVTPDSTAPGFPVEAARRVIDEVKLLRPLWLGDYYPLTEIDLDERHWCGWQLNRPDLGKGFLALFRRPQSRYATLDVTLRGLDESAEYEVAFFDEEKKTVMTGLDLQALQVEIDSPAKSVLILYHRRTGAVDG